MSKQHHPSSPGFRVRAGDLPGRQRPSITRTGAILALGCLFLQSAVAEAAPESMFQAPAVLQVDTHVESPSARAGDLVRLVIELDIDEGWHVNSNQPLDEFLIPTEVWIDPSSPVSVGRMLYPEPVLRQLAFSDAS